MELKKLLNKHRELKFPSWPENDEFSDWLAEFAEIDPYYFGLFSSIDNGLNLKIDDSFLKELESKLEKFKNLSEDKVSYEECKEKLNSLRVIMDLIKKS